jgi:hypothetical protein
VTLSLNGSELVCVFGGYGSRAAEAFDVRRWRWRKLSDAPEQRFGACALALGGGVCVVAGGKRLHDGRVLETADEFDLARNRWRGREAFALPRPLFGVGVAFYDAKRDNK